jgi:CBS domain-containing protein
MILCPACGAENLDGADECDQCQLPLTQLSSPQASTAVERGLLKDRIEVLHPRPPITVSPETPVAEVLRQMVAENLGCAAIVDKDNHLLGLFTERDALMRLNVDAAKMADKPVRAVMTQNPTTLRSRDKIAFALHRMNVGGFRHIPILDDNDKLVGIISVRGILAYLTQRHLAKA